VSQQLRKLAAAVEADHALCDQVGKIVADPMSLPPVHKPEGGLLHSLSILISGWN
jgi:hypothetical protein